MNPNDLNVVECEQCGAELLRSYEEIHAQWHENNRPEKIDDERKIGER